MARKRRGLIGLALAGGGPEGAVWEIGALRALDEAIEGIDLNELDVYVGVSAGAFLAANLANNLTTAQMCRAIVKHDPGEHPFTPETFFTPAVGEFLRRGVSVPKLLFEAVAGFAANPRDRSLADSLTRMSRALPVAVFDNEPIRQYLRTIYTMKGRTDDFRQLDHELYVIAADLDRGVPVIFGSPGLDHVAISRAIQASSALPGLYPPVEIDDRRIVDGVLLKTLHASVALDQGVKLLFAFNPIVPVDVSRAHLAAVEAEERYGDEEQEESGGNGARSAEFDLERRGLPTVLSQTFRTLIHSRLTVGMKQYETRYKDADVVLFEPDREDTKMFFTNIFSFSARRRVAAHAYRSVRRDLRERCDEIGPVLERHGLRLRCHVLEDESRDLWEGVGLPREDGVTPTRQTLHRLDRALDRIERMLR